MSTSWSPVSVFSHALNPKTASSHSPHFIDCSLLKAELSLI